MLSLFPYLLSYSLFIPTTFRLVLAIVFIVFAYKNATNRDVKKSQILEKFKLKPGHLWLWVLVLIEIAGGVLLLFGLYTQGASLALSVILLLGAIAKYKDKDAFSVSIEVVLLLLLLTASLLFLGPGFFSIDRPL